MLNIRTTLGLQFQSNTQLQSEHAIPQLMQGQPLFPSEDNAILQFEGEKSNYFMYHLTHNSLLMPTSKLLVS